MGDNEESAESGCDDGGQGSESVRPIDDWCFHFFGEETIVHTLQCLLLSTNKTIEDLCALCCALHHSKIIIGLSQQGLMPIAGDHLYMFPYARMSKKQLQVLRAVVRRSEQTFAVVYPHDEYVVYEHAQQKVDSVMMLFGASCILAQGLSTTRATKRAHMWKYMDYPDLMYHVNATLFNIVHACGIRQGVGLEVSALMRKHGVAPDPNK